MKIALPSKNRFPLEHLSQDAAGAPHVNGWRVPPQLEEKLWRPVPSSHDQSGVLSSCLAIALALLRDWFVIVSRQTEICNLESAAIIDEQVGGLHISMEDMVVVEVSEPFEQLQHVALDLWDAELDIGIV